MEKINNLLLFFLSVLCIYAIYVVQTTDVAFQDKTYIGISFVVVNLILLTLKSQYYIYFTGITLFLSTINLIAFTATVIKMESGFSIGSFSVELILQPLSLLLFLIWISTLLIEIRKKNTQS